MKQLRFTKVIEIHKRGRGNNNLTFFFPVLNFPNIRVRIKMTLPFLSSWTNLLYDGLLRSQILFMSSKCRKLNKNEKPLNI